MNLNGYKKHLLKSTVTIFFLLAFAIFSTYFIYQKFAKQSEKDYDVGEMEVVFHTKSGNQITMKKFQPVSDAVGLTSPAYSFTVHNNTLKDIKYKIMIKENEEEIEACGCSEKKIPMELLKLSLRKDHLAPDAFVLSEYDGGMIHEDILKAGEQEDYSIRIWAMNSNFIVDKTNHFHANIEVVEE